ncbi:12442_t:CDS:2 [Funneliformis geosporum]|uniref:histone acetyltransferase n=1 Tax=Funneliformis geosporum TaxID=1117311 RepID=A0A9W4SQP0_9GLOM|nr:12442_t:CDS:2 [Funneliformis geosporum]CAI2177072.1 11343_t:CDS:2 [Funneliformis geosporum]
MRTNTSYPTTRIPIHSLSNYQRHMKIGRYMACKGNSLDSTQNQCSCKGWRPNSVNGSGRIDLCTCGHKLGIHGNVNDIYGEDFYKLLNIAIQIDEYLDNKGKLLDFEYVDKFVQKMRDQMAITINQIRQYHKIICNKEPFEKDLNLNERNNNFDHRLIFTEEQEGDIRWRIINNDGSRENLFLLTSVKELISTALPKMPAEYIARVVYNHSHYNLVIVKEPNKVIGGICYRPFTERNFIEIVFFAVNGDYQDKGYGRRLMNRLKFFMRDVVKIKYILVYADESAIGFFRKIGFTTNITLDKDIWRGYIKDYSKAKLMQSTFVPKINYDETREILLKQKQSVKEKIARTVITPIIYPGLQCFKNGSKSIDPMSVPGIKESGWTPELERRAKETAKYRACYLTMLKVMEDLENHKNAWPFKLPVDPITVPDYYDIIKEPMDFSTVRKRMENNQYLTLKEFAIDVQKIWDNCKYYNSNETYYYKFAEALEKFFTDIMLENGIKLP